MKDDVRGPMPTEWEDAGFETLTDDDLERFYAQESVPLTDDELLEITRYWLRVEKGIYDE